MPYTISNPPANIKSLPKGAQRLWIRTFNSVAKDTGSETSARQAAWGNVKKRYKKGGDKWERKTNGSVGTVLSDNSVKSYFTAESAREGVLPRFRKQILKKGVFTHPQFPDEKVTIGKKEINAIITAFEAGAFDKVPVLSGTHDEEKIERTVGEVIELHRTKLGLDAVIEIADELVVQKIKTVGSSGKGLISSVSVSIGPVTTDDGTKYKLALWHLALVTHPHFTQMENFEELAARLPHSDVRVLINAQGGNDVNAENLDEKTIHVRKSYWDQFCKNSTTHYWIKETHNKYIIVSSKQGLFKRLYSIDGDGNVEFSEPLKVKTKYVSAEVKMADKKATKTQKKEAKVDELSLLSEHGLKYETVEAMKESVENGNKIGEIFSEAGIDNGDFEGLSAHITNLSSEHTALTDRVAGLEQSNLEVKAEVDVAKHMREGKIAPAQKEHFLILRMEKPDLFANMMETAPIIVDTEEYGHNDGQFDHSQGKTEEEVQSDVEKYKRMSSMVSTVNSSTNGKSGG